MFATAIRELTRSKMVMVEQARLFRHANPGHSFAAKLEQQRAEKIEQDIKEIEVAIKLLEEKT